RLHEERARFMPGGNTRTVIHVDPFPLTIVRGEGVRIVDADGDVYLDFGGAVLALAPRDRGVGPRFSRGRDPARGAERLRGKARGSGVRAFRVGRACPLLQLGD